MQCFKQFLNSSLVSDVVLRLGLHIVTGLNDDALSGGLCRQVQLVFSGDLIAVPIEGVIVALHGKHVDPQSLLVLFDVEDLEHPLDPLPPTRPLEPLPTPTRRS